jgi:cellulose biosynthesis protein BcsQ
LKRPFVISIASEKGGVGKTTIATNLAVYLKALREDLQVTIASFDNHFSIDKMFAFGIAADNSVTELIEGYPLARLINQGQYGVQYLASAQSLRPPPYGTEWLRHILHSNDIGGIFILDTRPILDWFTKAALLAADLVLVPIKDLAALDNADALRQILSAFEHSQRLWLIPSLVDSRARLDAEVRVHEFLACSARERDYQVLDICISKSPKVESLASGFSSRIRPVLTHARNTAVHGQFKALAEFVLSLFDAEAENLDCLDTGIMEKDGSDLTEDHLLRVLESPHYMEQFLSNHREFYAVEERIENLDQQLSELMNEMQDTSLSIEPAQLGKLVDRHACLQEELGECLAIWESLHKLLEEDCES